MCDDIEALLHAHELIVQQRENDKREFNHPNMENWARGHINGLNEARNRVEQAILERVDDE